MDLRCSLWSCCCSIGNLSDRSISPQLDWSFSSQPAAAAAAALCHAPQLTLSYPSEEANCPKLNPKHTYITSLSTWHHFFPLGQQLGGHFKSNEQPVALPFAPVVSLNCWWNTTFTLRFCTVEHCRIHMHTKQKCPDERQISPVSSADAASNNQSEPKLQIYKVNSWSTSVQI